MPATATTPLPSATPSTLKPPLFKIVMLGDSSVGKTTLVAKLVNPSAPYVKDVPATMGIEFECKLLSTSAGSVKAQIWDTAGQERFARVLLPTYFRKARGVLMVFDVSNPSTLSAVEERWMVQISDHSDGETLQKILVANKADLSTPVSTETLASARRLAAKHNMLLFETSAKTGLNVQLAFEKLLDLVYLQALNEVDAKTGNLGDEGGFKLGAGGGSSNTKKASSSAGCC
jgi:small GTP-binding protein